MCYSYLIFVVFVVIFSKPVMSSWDFAVSSKGRINFYTSDWKLVTSAAHQFDQVSALAFDETEDTLYFNDQIHRNETIFSLKLSQNDNHYVERIVKKAKEEQVQGIAFDPLERTLYWTDTKNSIIYQMNLNTQSEPSILIKLSNTTKPHGIAIDVCRRKLYWTNANVLNSTIERISLDGSKYEVLINKNLDMPRGIVVDQYTSRIFWVDDLLGDHFAVESANLDGTDRKQIVHHSYHVPFDVDVDDKNIYWTDVQDSAVWRIRKQATEDDIPVKVQNFTETNVPKGIIVRNHFMSTQAANKECKAVIDLLKSSGYATTPKALVHPMDVMGKWQNEQCLNDGVLNSKTNSCDCQLGYKGDRCQIPSCYNYCVEGTCQISSTGNPMCKCRPGFNGDRCEYDVCNNYCLNGGHCLIENDERNCKCPTSFHGQRCEIMDVKEMCTRFCNKEDIDERNVELEIICNNCSKNGTFIMTKPYFSAEEQQGSCQQSVFNRTAVFVSCGVVLSLILVFVIIKTIRHVYQPLRPRIKKTYVVHKNVVPTPLTCRPTTEQCEITIENCCNMNICDTPCFDPKTLQAEANKKDDKKTLLNHCEDMMY